MVTNLPTIYRLPRSTRVVILRSQNTGLEGSVPLSALTSRTLVVAFGEGVLSGWPANHQLYIFVPAHCSLRKLKQLFKAVIFNHCAMAHWCATDGLQVCPRSLGWSYIRKANRDLSRLPAAWEKKMVKKTSSMVNG